MICNYCGEKITEDQQYWNEYTLCVKCDEPFHNFYCIEAHLKESKIKDCNK